RARIPMRMSTESKVGDIHKYSAASIEKVKLSRGKKRAIKIMIEMKASVGFFQVEEVLFKKINISPVKSHIELYAGVKGREIKCYLS
ncbi:phosphohydrolase, partial [bacterium]|nr:phosphohydrolase [bacterium]